MRGYVNERNGKDSPLVSESFYNAVMGHANRLDSEIIYDRDFHYDYFGFKIDNIYDTLKQRQQRQTTATTTSAPQ